MDARSAGDVKDLKKDLEKKKDSVKDVFDLFNKKKKKD